MLAAHERQRLHAIEVQLQQSDPWLARSLSSHEINPRQLRRRLADYCQRLLAAWMDAAGELHHFYPANRWH
jgi:hypothetical protein